MSDEIYVNTGTSFQQPFNDRTPLIVNTAVTAQRVAQAATNTQQPYPYIANAQTTYQANAQQPYPYTANRTISYPYIANAQTPYIANNQTPFPYIANGQQPYIAAAQQPYPYTANQPTTYARQGQSPFTYINQQPTTYARQGQTPYPYIANQPTTYARQGQAPYPYIANQPTTYPYIASGQQPYIASAQQPYPYTANAQTTYTANAQQPYPYTANAQTTYTANAQQPYPYTANQPTTYARQGRSPFTYQARNPLNSSYARQGQTPFTYQASQPFNARQPLNHQSPTNGSTEPSITTTDTNYWYTSQNKFMEVSNTHTTNTQFCISRIMWDVRMVISNSGKTYTFGCRYTGVLDGTVAGTADYAYWYPASGSGSGTTLSIGTNNSSNNYVDTFAIVFPSGSAPDSWSLDCTRTISSAGSGPIITNLVRDAAVGGYSNDLTDGTSTWPNGVFRATSDQGWSGGFSDSLRVGASAGTSTHTNSFSLKFRKSGYSDITIWSSKELRSLNDCTATGNLK